MQGKLIAVAYTLCTLKSVLSGRNLLTRTDASVFVQYHRRMKAFNFDYFENSISSFLWPEYFIDYFCENWFHVRLWHPSCVYFSAVNCSTKNAYLWNNIPWISTLIECIFITASQKLNWILFRCNRKFILHLTPS